jgi:hypothetical protein
MNTSPLAPANAGSAPRAQNESSNSPLSGAGVTAGAALVAGVLILIQGRLPTKGSETDYSPLAWVAVALGAIALLLVLVASYEWTSLQSESDRFGWLRRFFGVSGAAARLSAPVGWISAAVAAVVVATISLPQLVTGWQGGAVFASGLLALTLLAVLGWGPALTRAWPSGFRLSTLTVLGSLVALALVGAYLLLLWFLTTKTAAEAAEWARLVELRSTLEALAFAAAGALIGQTVARTAVTGELTRQQETIAHQDGELRVAGDTILTKHNALADSLNLLSPPEIDVTGATDPAELESIIETPVPPQQKVRQARSRLIEGLRAGR